jgi:hypothetical protein
MPASRLHVLPVRGDADWLRRVPAVHGAQVAAEEGVLKDEHKTSIARLEIDGRRAVVKHYRYMGARRHLKGLFRTHPAWRSLAAAEAMARRGVPTPAVLGLLERRSLGLAAECWLVTEDLDGAVEMDRYILRAFGAGCDRVRRKRFVLAFAPALAALMRSAVRHRDLKTCNVLVIERGDGWEFAFIDLDDAVVAREGTAATREDWVLALAQLNPSTPKSLPWTDRLRFLDALDDLSRFDRRALIAEVQELSRRRRRAYFSDEGPVEVDFV